MIMPYYIIILYNYCLPSYKANIESCQLEGVAFNISRVDNFIFTPYESNDCFIIPKILYDV